MKQHTIISVIGAGGKTTALLTLAQALSDRRVLLTTSTHIYPVAPPDSRALLIAPEADELLDVFCRFGEANLAFLTLEVRASNAPAIALYRKHGFEEAGRRKNYYTKPAEDAIIMTRYFKRIGTEHG